MIKEGDVLYFYKRFGEITVVTSFYETHKKQTSFRIGAGIFIPFLVYFMKCLIYMIFNESELPYVFNNNGYLLLRTQNSELNHSAICF